MNKPTEESEKNMKWLGLWLLAFFIIVGTIALVVTGHQDFIYRSLFALVVLACLYGARPH